MYAFLRLCSLWTISWANAQLMGYSIFFSQTVCPVLDTLWDIAHAFDRIFLPAVQGAWVRGNTQIGICTTRSHWLISHSHLSLGVLVTRVPQLQAEGWPPGGLQLLGILGSRILVDFTQPSKVGCTSTLPRRVMSATATVSWSPSPSHVNPRRSIYSGCLRHFAAAARVTAVSISTLKKARGFGHACRPRKCRWRTPPLVFILPNPLLQLGRDTIDARKEILMVATIKKSPRSRRQMRSL